MHGYEWLSKSVTVAILLISSVILVMLLASREFSIP